MNKIKGYINWILFHIPFSVSIWLGIYNGIDGAANIAMFIAWSFLFVSFFSANFEKDLINNLWGKWMVIDTAFNIAVVLSFIYFGFIKTGIAYCIGSIIIYALSENLKWQK